MKIPPPYVVIVFLLLVVGVLTRELVKYEPEIYKYRIYNNAKQKGWFDEEVALTTFSDKSTMVVLTMRQSNAGNSNSAPYTPHNQGKIFCYYDGKLFLTKDPLIGDQGTGGSVWPRLADMLIDRNIYKRIIIIPIAVGKTSIQDWSTGFCHDKLVAALADLNLHKIKLTHVLWHQGEANNGSPKAYYKQQLGLIVNTIKTHGQTAPFYVSIATYSPEARSKPLGIDTVIQNAQKEFIADNNNVLYGANTDTIIHAIDRFDAYHFSEIGVKKYAASWLTALQQRREK